MPRKTQQRFSYLQNPIVDDGVEMKHWSAHTDLNSEWIKRFAWFPKRSDITNEFIWLTNYWEYVIKMDTYGYEPRKDKQWKLIYTRDEYIQKKLSGEIKNE